MIGTTVFHYGIVEQTGEVGIGVARRN